MRRRHVSMNANHDVTHNDIFIHATATEERGNVTQNWKYGMQIAPTFYRIRLMLLYPDPDLIFMIRGNRTSQRYAYVV